MSRVLVTGGSGFVGRHLVEALDRAGWEVHSAGRTRCATHPTRVIEHDVDLLVEDDVARLLRTVRPAALAHLAWVTEPAVYWTSDLNAAWEVASLHLFRSFLDTGGRRVLGVGTSAEYDWSGPAPFNEDASPSSAPPPYARYKRETFDLARDLLTRSDATFVWARLFGPFGPHEDSRRLIPRTCLGLLRGETIRFGGPRHVRDFLHVAEVADALRTALESPFGGALNIGSGEGRTAQEVVAALAQALGASERVEWLAEDGSAPEHVVADTRRLREIIGWKARLAFHEQIMDACDWWRRLERAGTLR